MWVRLQTYSMKQSSESSLTVTVHIAEEGNVAYRPLYTTHYTAYTSLYIKWKIQNSGKYTFSSNDTSRLLAHFITNMVKLKHFAVKLTKAVLHSFIIQQTSWKK